MYKRQGEKVRPYIIHRSSIGCYERTMALLLEKYAGALPVWLSPTQVKVLSLTDRTADIEMCIRDRYTATTCCLIRRWARARRKINSTDLLQAEAILR